MKKFAVKDEKLIYSIYKNLRSQKCHVTVFITVHCLYKEINITKLKLKNINKCENFTDTHSDTHSLPSITKKIL